MRVEHDCLTEAVGEVEKGFNDGRIEKKSREWSV